MFVITPIVISSFASMVVFIIITIVAWRRRRGLFDYYFALTASCQVFWTMMVTLGYAATPISLKIFFATLDAWGYIAAESFLLLFAFSFAGHQRISQNKWMKAVAAFYAISNLLLVSTNPWHRLYWSDFVPQANNVILFVHGPAFIYTVITGYTLILSVLIVITMGAFRGSNIMKRQARWIIAALLTTIFLNVAYQTNIAQMPGVDWAAATSALFGLMVLWALYGDKLLEIAPITRNKLINNLSDGMIALDLKNRIIDINRSAAEALGGNENALLGKNLEEVSPRFCLELRETAEKEAKFELNMGDRHFYDVLASPLRDEWPKGLVGRLIILRDITERKQMGEALQRQNEILETLQQTMLELVNRHDMDDILQTLLSRIGGLLNAQHVSIDLLEEPDLLVTHAATPGQPLQKGDQMLSGEGGWLSWQAIETGQPAILEDYSTWPNRRNLYEGFPIHAIAVIPIHQRERVIGAINFSREEPNKPFSATEIYAAQQLAQMVALVLDNANLYTQLKHELAERKQVQEVLRISQENFMSYFNMGAVGMSVTMPGRNWVEVNDQLCRMLGYSKEELKQLTWSELTHSDDLNADMDLYNQAMQGERDSYQIDKRFIRRDGGILHASVFVSCQRFPDGSPRYFLASLVDISKRVEQEATLRATQEQLAEQRRSMAVVEERQRLARDLHDSVSQSLHGLNLFAETLTSSLAKPNRERTLQLAERLQETARQALKEARLMLYQLQPSELEAKEDLVHKIEARLSNVEERAGVRAALKVEGDAGQYPLEWRENLFRITIEALNNSLKHAQARNVQVTLRCNASAVEINVTDDGIGFDCQRTNTGGMGLHTMRERAELLGGTLEVRSSPGAGTSVIARVNKKEMS